MTVQDTFRCKHIIGIKISLSHNSFGNAVLVCLSGSCMIKKSLQEITYIRVNCLLPIGTGAVHREIWLCQCIFSQLFCTICKVACLCTSQYVISSCHDWKNLLHCWISQGALKIYHWFAAEWKSFSSELHKILFFLFNTWMQLRVNSSMPATQGGFLLVLFK